LPHGTEKVSVKGILLSRHQASGVGGSDGVVVGVDWRRLVSDLNSAAHEAHADTIIAEMHDAYMVVGKTSFIRDTLLESGGEKVIAGHVSGLVSVTGGSFTLHSSATSPAFGLRGSEFTLTNATLKSNSSQPLLNVNKPGQAIVINLFGATLKTGTGPVIKVTAATSVTINMAGCAVEANTVASESGTAIVVNRLDSEVSFAAQSGISGTLTDGTRADDAGNVGYTPAVTSNWTDQSIDSVGPALDELRAAVASSDPSTTKTITSSDSPYTISATEDVILVNTSDSAITVKLPAKAAGRRVVVKDSTGNSSTHNITVEPSGGGETIDGTANLKLNINFCSISIVCDGSNWFAF